MGKITITYAKNICMHYTAPIIFSIGWKSFNFGFVLHHNVNEGKNLFIRIMLGWWHIFIDLIDRD